jgi:hypothetical protein
MKAHAKVNARARRIRVSQGCGGVSFTIDDGGAIAVREKE